MIMHILGGGPAQLSAIRTAREKGFKTAVSDANPEAPGMAEADFQSHASTFDEESVYRDAKRIGSDFLMTTGTDQPVLTAAAVSERLGLPYFLTRDQALMVTNKKAMKTAFKKNNIPTMNFVFLKEDFGDKELGSLKFPLVIKPLDSQGQRGVIRVDTPDEIRTNFKRLLGFSRKTEILAEEYYPSTELTISGWAENGEARILSITDRVTIDNGPHIGVCVSHRYPSLCRRQHGELSELTQKITDMIGLSEGPLYFQILSGKEGFRVNEIACRLGGAYEDEFLPWMTGVRLMDVMIEMTARKGYTLPDQKGINRNLRGKFLSLQMFFCSGGEIYRQNGMEEVRGIDGVLGGRFLLAPGTHIRSRENSTQRAGYFIVTGSSAEEINRRLCSAYKMLRIEDKSGKSMILRYDNMLFPL